LIPTGTCRASIGAWSISEHVSLPAYGWRERNR
jgi:hypothetical protein